MTANSQTTVAILTPPGRGAVAVVAVDGPQAISLVEHFFRPKGQPDLISRPTNQIVYGHWDSDQAENVIVCRRTAETVEVHCHGGHAAVRRILDDLIAAGAVEQNWQTRLCRSEASSIRRAARIALAQTNTFQSAAILVDQYHGSLETSISHICKLLGQQLSTSSDSEITATSSKIKDARELIDLVLERAPLGLHLTQPWQVVIAGPPNVGKSSLVNALLGYQRAIVFDQPGTTRDAVATLTALEGWPVMITDTAGWRASDDPIEIAGVAIAESQAEQADCLILVFDASQPWTDENRKLIEHWQPAIVVGNKIDLVVAENRDPTVAEMLFTSAQNGEGIETLANRIIRHVASTNLQPGDAVPFTVEQIEQLQAAAAALRNNDVALARECLLALLA